MVEGDIIVVIVDGIIVMIIVLGIYCIDGMFEDGVIVV